MVDYLDFKYTIIQIGSTTGEQFTILHWDNDIKAPISNIMQLTKDELKAYFKEWDLNDLSNPGHFNEKCRAIYVNQFSSDLLYLLANNNAGPNRECITWEEILELYK